MLTVQPQAEREKEEAIGKQNPDSHILRKSSLIWIGILVSLVGALSCQDARSPTGWDIRSDTREHMDYATDSGIDAERRDVTDAVGRAKLYFIRHGNKTALLRDPDDVEYEASGFDYPNVKLLRDLKGVPDSAGLKLAIASDIESVWSRELRSNSGRPRVGRIAGRVQDRGNALYIENGEFQPCSSAQAFDVPMAPRRHDQCVYVDGNKVDQFEIKLKEPPDSNSTEGNVGYLVRLQVRQTKQFKVTCRFRLPLRVGSVKQWSIPFRMPLTGSNQPRDDGLQAAECENDATDKSETIQFGNSEGWFSGMRSPTVEPTSLAIEFPFDGHQISVWARVREKSEFQPYE